MLKTKMMAIKKHDPNDKTIYVRIETEEQGEMFFAVPNNFKKLILKDFANAIVEKAKKKIYYYKIPAQQIGDEVLGWNERKVIFFQDLQQIIDLLLKDK